MSRLFCTVIRNFTRRIRQWIRGDEAIVISACIVLIAVSVCATFYFTHDPLKLKTNLKLQTTKQAKLHKVYVNYSQSHSIGEEEKKTWYCDAGSCVGGNGITYQCGAALCDLKQTECGCTCIEVSGAPYPKSFCGKVNPYAGSEAEPGSYAKWMFHPFEVVSGRR